MNSPAVNGLVPKEPKLPSLSELFDDTQTAYETEALNKILNSPIPDKWIKKHPTVDNHFFLPIDKVEFLLRKIFKRYRVKITGQGTAFNGVWVTVRVKYFNPVTEEWEYQDGIGSAQLQTKKGTSPADLANINYGAVGMAFPIAKSEAIKDACHLIGNIFGANLNRRDTIAFTPDLEIIDRHAKALQNGNE